MISEIKISGFERLYSALTQLPSKVAVACEQKAALSGALVVRDAARAKFKSITQQHTGRTLRRIRARKRTDLSKGGLVVYSVGISRYGMFVELGTRSGYPISARRKKVMAIWKGIPEGDDVSLNVHDYYDILGKGPVKHPGVAARPFLRPALYDNTEKIIERVRQVLAAAITKRGGAV